MKVLIIKCNQMLTRGTIVEEQKRLAKEFREDRVVVLGPGFEYEVVDIDNIVLDRNSFDMNTSFQTYKEAAELLTQMNDLINKYGTISVAEYLKLIGLIPNYRDSKYGWNDLTGHRIVLKRIGNRDFYELRLPEPIEI